MVLSSNPHSTFIPCSPFSLSQPNSLFRFPRGISYLSSRLLSPNSLPPKAPAASSHKSPQQAKLRGDIHKLVPFLTNNQTKPMISKDLCPETGRTAVRIERSTRARTESAFQGIPWNFCPPGEQGSTLPRCRAQCPSASCAGAGPWHRSGLNPRNRKPS